MLAAVPLFGQRVAPRCHYCKEMRMVRLQNGTVQESHTLPLQQGAWDLFVDTLLQWEVDILICGGIEHENQKQLENAGIRVVCNVSGLVDDIITALAQDRLEPWFGYDDHHHDETFPQLSIGGERCLVNCFECRERTCCTGDGCIALSPQSRVRLNTEKNPSHVYYLTSLTGAPISRLENIEAYCRSMNCQRLGIVFCTAFFDDLHWLLDLIPMPVHVFPLCCQFGVQRNQNHVDFSKPACDVDNLNLILSDTQCDLLISIGPCKQFNASLDEKSGSPVITVSGKDTQAGGHLFPEKESCSERESWRRQHCLNQEKYNASSI